MSDKIKQPRRKRLKRWLRRAVVAAFIPPAILFMAFHVSVAFWPYPKGIEHMPADATFLCDTNGRPLAEFAAPDDQWRLTLTESEISPHLLAAIVAAEDARFYEHHGVDWKSAAAALWQDSTSLRFKRGGSTLTMQLHRLRQPAAHTLLGKFEQAVRATQIEKHETKQQILVEYLNRAPFGGNLVGAGAASLRYFGRSCRDLSLAQAALLAGLPKNPTNDRPDRFPERAKSRRDHILDRMLVLNMITAKAHDDAIAEPIDAKWHPLAQSKNLLAINTNDSSTIAIQSALPTLTRLAHQSAGGKIQTTLNLPTQQLIATAAQEHLDQQNGQITEIAVVVIDTTTANCIAAVSLSQSGKNDLDLTQRPRSTGSVIKPLIYAAAFDAGIVSPQSMLDDSPAAWPGYSPGNYDHQFQGRMTAAEALAQSRNIPALRLLSQVGVERAVGTCAAVGLATLANTPQRYGLSLAIGGAEATPLEIAEAYTTLANQGRHRPLNWMHSISPSPGTPGEGRGEGLCVIHKRPSDPTNDNRNEAILASAKIHPALSPRACLDTIASLNNPDRTAAISPEAARLHPASKTGTSSGHRDAWCAVIGPAHVIVVWMGNASAAGAQSLVGAEAAAPLALRLIAAIDARAEQKPIEATAPARLAIAPAPATQVAIISPTNNSEIIRLPDLAASQQKILLRAAITNSKDAQPSLHWYIDGSPFATSTQGDSLWWPPNPGLHEIRVTDDIGHADQIKITVRAPGSNVIE